MTTKQELQADLTRRSAALVELQADHQKLLSEYGERLAELHALRGDRDTWREQAQRALIRANEYQDALLACQASRHELREALQAAYTEVFTLAGSPYVMAQCQAALGLNEQ